MSTTMSTKITYREGDATLPQAGGRKIIVHICNNLGLWGAGFTGALSHRWASPERLYRDSAPHALGSVTYAQVAPDIAVANMVAQVGVTGRPGFYGVHEEALEDCLLHVAETARACRASVHMPRIGCGLAGSVWSEIEPIVQRTLCAEGVPVYVYDLPEGEPERQPTTNAKEQ